MNNEANDNLTHHLSQHGFNGHDYGDFKDGWFASWQAATTALLEKLRGEGALNAAVTNLREMDNWLTKDAEGDTIENYEAIARAVIEALVKELVG